MPIADAEFSKSTHAHLIRPATEPVLAALRAWRDAPDHVEWWWLIVQHSDQLYTAIRFAELRDALRDPDIQVHMNTPLAELPYRRPNPADPDHPFPGVVTPRVVDGDALTTEEAQRMIHDSPGGVLVALRQGHFRGILSAAAPTTSVADPPLIELLGQFEKHLDTETAILPIRDELDAALSESEPDED
jgi:hypothetical protein